MKAAHQITRRENLPSLTSLRFFAALIVIMQHYTFREALFPPQVFLGYEAVTFFFVLSGFILTYSHAPVTRGGPLDISARAFVTARAARILPVYYLALLVAFPWYLYRLVTDYISLGEFIVGATLVLLLLQSWVPHLALYWNDPAWSLSVEALFYLAYPLIWRWTQRLSDRAMLISAAFLVAFTGLARHFFLDISSENVSLAHFSLYFPLLHLPQFIFGVALGRVFVYHRDLLFRYARLLLAIALTALVLLVTLHTALPILRNSAITAFICGAIILAFAQPPAVLGWRPLSGSVLNVLGEASYAMYILHYPLLLWYGQALRSAGMALPYWLDFLVYLALVVATSVFSFFTIERPARRWINDRLQPRDNAAGRGQAD